MKCRNVSVKAFLIACLWLYPNSGIGQVKNVPEAFKALRTDPEIIFIDNTLDIPTKGGHFQGVQVITENEVEKMLVSGSSLTMAYVLLIDLATQTTEKLVPLMLTPYRHAGGIQVSEPYLAVGIEDNMSKTVSKVCLYNYRDTNLLKGIPNLNIDRKGKAKLQTAGATGLLAVDTKHLVVVANWDSRNWDFYHIDAEKNDYTLIETFNAPDNWANYQSINLIKDDEAIYAVGFYQKNTIGYADMILVSELLSFQPIMELVDTKSFQCKQGVDFSAAAGLQIDQHGKLHIWAAQRDAYQEIAIHRFSQK